MHSTLDLTNLFAPPPPARSPRQGLRTGLCLALCMSVLVLSTPALAAGNDHVAAPPVNETDEPVLIGIGIGLAATAIWVTVDSVALSALYFGIGVVQLDGGDCGVYDDSDTVTRTTWLVEGYVDFDAWLANACGNVKEERHFWIKEQRWSSANPTKEWVLPNDNHSGARRWELRKKGEVLLKGGAADQPPAGDGVETWTWDVAPAEATTIALAVDLWFTPEDMSITIVGDDAFVAFSPDIVSFVNESDPPFGLSHGLIVGSDVADPELPLGAYDITLVDAIWELDPEAVVPYFGQPEEEIISEAIAGAARLIPGPRATPGWEVPGELMFGPGEVEFDGVYYRVHREMTVSLHDAVTAAGYAGVYQYTWSGPGEPGEGTPLPTVLPGDAELNTLYGAENGGEYRALRASVDGIEVIAPEVALPCEEHVIAAIARFGPDEVPGEQVSFQAISGDVTFLDGGLPDLGEPSFEQQEFVIETGPSGEAFMPIRINQPGPTEILVRIPGRNIETFAFIDALPVFTGDMNCDGGIDFDDISPFVLALTSPDAYYAQYPACNYFHADANGDCAVDFDDISPFVALLSGN